MQEGRSETHISSQSDNPRVLAIYKQILEHAYYDSDYWFLVGGDLLLWQLYDFNDQDVADLEADLHNWAFKELEIFNGVLFGDNSDNSDDLLPVRCHIYGYIFTLASYYIAFDWAKASELLLQNIEFFKEGRVADNALIQKMKDTVYIAESTLGFVDSIERYYSRLKFDDLKAEIQQLG